MKLSLRWLRDYATLDAPLETLRRVLVDTGTEVDSIDRVAEGTVVARITALAPVPESTRGVRLADLDTGGPSPVRVVTGAPNVSVGDLVPYAPPGVRLPGLDQPLGVRAMFGGKYQSPGMLCSAVELGVGSDADGILLLDTGRPGQPIHEVLELDAILEVDVSTNRPDCLCHLGIARELAAALGEPLREPPAEVPAVLLSASALDERLSIDVVDQHGCPRFAARVIENVGVGPSPEWLQQRLRAIGLRPINNVVDVANYVAAELGQPLHAFDVERFRQESSPVPTAGQATQVVVRGARAGERVATLDGEEHTLAAGDLVVCAGDRPVSIAGIIGGQSTAVDGATRTVLLEAASWHGPSIRATSRRLGVRTDASSHFEKGLSDTLPPLALERAAALIAEVAGGHVLRGVADEHPAPLPQIPPIHVRSGYLDGLLGMHVDPSEAATALVRLGFTVTQEADGLVVEPPHFRRDVAIPADIAEEVGRSLGYGRIPSTLPGRRTEVGPPAPAAPVEDAVREACCGAGFDEAITYSFTASSVAAGIRGLGGGRTPIPLRNPLSEEWSVMRVSLLPGLLGALATNQHRGAAGASLFEIGRAYWEGERQGPPAGSTPGGDEGLPPLPAEPRLLGLVSQADEVDGEAAADRLRHLQAVVAWLADELGGTPVTAEPAAVDGLRTGRSARLIAGGRDVGVLGELDPAAASTFSLRGRIAVAELDLDAVLPPAPRTPRFIAPPRFPAVLQDLAVTVPLASRAADALTAARQTGGEVLESVELIDEYRGAGIPQGRKSWTFRLVFRAPDRTLTAQEIQPIHAAVAGELTRRFDARVRA